MIRKTIAVSLILTGCGVSFIQNAQAEVGRYQINNTNGSVSVIDTTTGQTWIYNGGWNDLGRPTDPKKAVTQYYTPSPAVPVGIAVRPYATPYTTVPTTTVGPQLPTPPPGAPQAVTPQPSFAPVVDRPQLITTPPSYPAPPPQMRETEELVVELRRLAPKLDATKIKLLRQAIEELKEETDVGN